MARRATAPAKESPYRPIPVNKYGGIDAKQRRLQRRERLMAAGFTLFAAHGFANTSIAALAEESGCALRTFYEEFGSREALLLEMYDRVISGVLRDTIAGMRAAGPGRQELIRSGVDAYVGSMTRNTAHAKIALIEVVGVDRSIDKRRRDALKAFVAGLAEAIVPRQRANARQLDDLELVIFALAGASDELLTEWLLSKGRLTPDRLSGVLYGLWLRGLDLA